MPKKFPESAKVKWLELYENGKTEKWIAWEFARCDPRTVKRGIEEARRKQDVVIARRELVKDALRKHQDSLFEELDKIVSSLFLPPEGHVVLPWSHGGDSILAESETAVGGEQTGEFPELAMVGRGEEGAVRRLLRQHLKNDRLWKMLAQWEKAYAAHLIARTILQRKIVAVIQDKTGCKLFDRSDAPRPFLCSSNTGDSFFRATLDQAFGAQKKIDLENDIVINITSGDVRYGNLVLAEAPGNEEKVKANLIEALKELKDSSESVSVVDTYRALEEAQMRVRQVVEQIKLLGLILGQCEICRRLGM